MQNYEIKVTIYANCKAGCTEEELQFLRKSFTSADAEGALLIDMCFQPIVSEGFETFYFTMNYTPICTMITARYRIPDSMRWNKQYAEDHLVPLDKYLSIEEIKTMHYYDYADEYIYRISQQEKSDEGSIACDAKDVNLVSRKLISYLARNTVIGITDENLQELKNIERLSSIAAKHNWDIYILHPMP